MVVLISNGEKVFVKKILLVLATVAAVALVFSSVASANSLKCAHGSSCGPGSVGGPSGTGSGTLPFTGLGLTGIAAVGGLLLLSGLTLQRASRRRR